MMKKYINVCCDNIVKRYGDDYVNSEWSVRMLMRGKKVWYSHNMKHETVDEYLTESLGVISPTERDSIKRLVGYKLLNKHFYGGLGFKERMKITNFIKLYE